MENAKKHWKILQELGTDLENRVRSFLVIGEKGDGVIVVTENGDGYWLGKMKFEIGELRTATEPTLLDVSDLVHIAQGDNHILLLNKRGQIYSMGMNQDGQLGLGTVDYINYSNYSYKIYSSPQLFFSPLKFTSVRCGFRHSLSMTDDGKVWAWGRNERGQVGVPSSPSSFPFPRQIPELDPHRVVAVECGGHHSLALTDLGEVYAWGENCGEQLGDGSKSSKHTPTQIPTPNPVQSMAAGENHTLLLTESGEVYACGKNECGQLGLPNDTKSSASLVKVAGLPPISQIASHHATSLSIAMSSDHRCFVWGKFADGTSISTPFKLPTVYSTVESPLSFYSTSRSTPHSVSLPAMECPNGAYLTNQSEFLYLDYIPGGSKKNRLLYRIDKMFDNPNCSPDVRFQVGDQFILAHRSVLQISSDYFHRFFSSADVNSPFATQTSQSDSSCSQHTSNPSEPDAGTTPHCPQVTISIRDHSYPAFHAYLRFLYLGTLEVASEHLTDLFSLSVAYLESDLQQLCLSLMRTTLSPTTCCLYYQLTLRHSLPKFAEFQQEVVQFISANFLKVIATDAYQSMDADLFKKLTISIANNSP